ncbi:hypothetical protein VP01_818g5 [Puccinia sorghi]|uniref:Integrase catalytic domain-containing protein n=1 Tax=Puccinia sorghi TaxID=27349 RepID=A0A0L6UC69_9BASI|nr:hypothetical protein VP01_818g5 [Puccinia sorghi]
MPSAAANAETCSHPLAYISSTASSGRGTGSGVYKLGVATEEAGTGYTRNQTVASFMSDISDDAHSTAETASVIMDKLNTTILKTAIEAIPLLTQDNYTLWKNRVENMLDLQELLTPLTSPTGVLSASEDVQLRTILTSKLESTIHANVITHDNEKSSKKIWKSISDYFASSQASNRARVFNAVLHIQFNPNDVQDFITQVKSALSRLHEVGIDLPKDIIAYLILHKLPPTMINISQQITHSDKPITADLVLDHLCLYANDQQILANSVGSSKSTSVSLLTDDSKKCKKGWHNPRSTGHTMPNCWFLYPHLRPVQDGDKGKKSEQSVSSFHSSLSKLSASFVLDSGSSSHMVSDANLFISLDHSEQGVVRTSSGEDSLEIKGIGSVKLTYEHGELFLHQVLYVPNLVINLLSVRCLALEDYNVQFHKHSFSISRNNNLLITGHYEGNLPCLNFSNAPTRSFLSSAEELHKSLGHNIKKCKACALGKITKASFKSKHLRAKRPFEELHLDLIGPISPISREGDKYILTVVDSNTRYCSAIPINKKSDVVETLSTIIDYEAKRFGYHPSVLHSDRGGEFINMAMEDYCHRLNHLMNCFEEDPCHLITFILSEIQLRSLMSQRNRDPKSIPRDLKADLSDIMKISSYRILADDGRIVDTKSVQFLEFRPEEHSFKLDDEEECEIILEKEAPSHNHVENNKEIVKIQNEEYAEKEPRKLSPSVRHCLLLKRKRHTYAYRDFFSSLASTTTKHLRRPENFKHCLFFLLWRFKNSFLSGNSMKAPFLRLKKFLCGLKQAPANWFETLTSWLQDINHFQSSSDPCLFSHKDGDSFVFFHVDELASLCVCLLWGEGPLLLSVCEADHQPQHPQLQNLVVLGSRQPSVNRQAGTERREGGRKRVKARSRQRDQKKLSKLFLQCTVFETLPCATLVSICFAPHNFKEEGVICGGIQVNGAEALSVEVNPPNCAPLWVASTVIKTTLCHIGESKFSSLCFRRRRNCGKGGAG